MCLVVGTMGAITGAAFTNYFKLADCLIVGRSVGMSIIALVGITIAILTEYYFRLEDYQNCETNLN